MNFHVQHHTKTIYIQYHFHKISSICYLVIAEDGTIDGQMQKEVNSQHQTIKIVRIICNVNLFDIIDLDS